MSSSRWIRQTPWTGLLLLAFATLAYGHSSNSSSSITGVTPSSGPAGGGTLVTITGANFISGQTVNFGGVDSTQVTFVNSGEVLAVTPAHAAGCVSVTVSMSKHQTATLRNGFTYSSPPAPTISSVSPGSGIVSGGTQVTIAGTNFETGASVTFGSTAASGVTISSPSQITAFTPAEGAGTVSVTVQNPDGGSATLSQAFTFNGLPTLTSVTPNAGTVNGGIQVTVAGSNFESGATVSFGPTAATGVTLNGSTSLTAITPAESAGTVSVTVQNPDGGSATLANAYTYTTSNSPAGCGAQNGGVAPYDQSTCGDVTTDGSVLSYEPNYVNSMATVINSCGASITLNGSYKLTSPLNCGSGSVAIYISPSFGQNAIYLYLNNQTVTGQIYVNDWGGPFPGGVHVFGGTVNCNVVSGECLTTEYTNGSAPPSSAVIYHHITGNNAADAGNFCNVDATLSSPMSGGQYSAIMHHMTITVSGGTVAYDRSGGCDVSGENQTANLYNFQIVNSPGTNHYSEGLVCYNAYSCDVHNNDITFNQFTGNGDSVPGRMVLLDGDAFGNGPQTPGFTENANLYNNYFCCSNIRGVRQRSARNVQVHDNLLDQMTDGQSYLGGVHWGDPTGAGPGGTTTYDYVNSIYSNNTFVFVNPVNSGAIAFFGKNAIDVTFENNQISCSGAGCTGDSQPGAIVTAQILNGSGANYFTVSACNNTPTQQLASTLSADGYMQTQVSTLTNMTSGTCSAADGAVCSQMPKCP